MLADKSMLPGFRSPPVDEVAVGMQFSLAGQFLPTHFGRFHERIKDKYPGVQMLPPLPPQREVYAGSTEPSPMAGLSPFIPFLPRVLFVSADDESLIQLQTDRLYFNWRKRTQNAYPHYARFREEFSRIYAFFENFASGEGLGSVTPTQCDILYVNPIAPGSYNADLSAPERVFRCWSAMTGERWQIPLEDLSFNARYQLLNETGHPFGRLTASMSSGVGVDSVQHMRLELAARGHPLGSGLDGVRAFHDAGHEAIVRCFVSITTEEMHAHWGIYDHE